MHEALQTTRRMLLVDDDPTQLMIIKRIGINLGFDVTIAATLEGAVHLIERESFDVLALDLSLGERDGVEILRLLADRSTPLPMSIVIISGCDERVMAAVKRMAEGLGLSVSDCLGKPVDLARLRQALCIPVRSGSHDRAEVATLDITGSRIEKGLANGEFSVEFQPKVNLATGRVVGAEALARWDTPEFGRVSPSLFIPVAEQSGLMPRLTTRNVSLALRGAKPLIDRDPGFAIAVNISGSLLSDVTLPEQLEGCLRVAGISGRSLIAEITETTAMSDVDRATDVLVRLRLKNIGAAIDDFGTGYSSLAVLARLPFSELKIDQSFVGGCSEDSDKMKIIHACVGLAHGFGMKAVVEGVEDNEVLSLVRRAGCDIGQGHLFAPALRAEQALDWISSYTLPLNKVAS